MEPLPRTFARPRAGKSALALLLLLVVSLAAAQARPASAGSAAPTVKITSQPPASTFSTTAAISFTTSNARLVQCSLDGGNFFGCVSPQNYAGLSVGKHKVVVRATRDKQSATASAAWEVVAPPAPPPSPSSLTVASSIANGSTVTGSTPWEATPSQAVSKVQFYVDGTLRWTEGYAPYVFNGDGNKLDTTTLTDGSHVLRAVATGSSGETGETRVTVQVANGTATPPPPQPVSTFTVASSIADGATISASVPWQATPNRSVTKVDFFVDGSLKWTEGYPPYVFNGDGNLLDAATLNNGTHVLRVLATGGDGTTATTTATVQVAYSTAPAPTPSPPPAFASSAGRVQFMEKTSPSTDQYTNNPTPDQQQWFRDHWQRAIVYASYWDSKNSWYPQTWVYQDAYAIYNPSTLANQHPEWILKDTAGNKLFIPWGCSGGTCPQYAADIGSPGWRQYFIDRCKAAIAKGYKGLHLDDVDMDINAGNGAGQKVAPIDPRTGQPMTDSQWKEYFAQFMEQVRAALPGVEIAQNAIWFAGGGNHDGMDPFIQRQIRAADMINLERGFNDGGLTGGTGTWSVFAFMRYIDNVHSYGSQVVVQSYATDTTSAEYNLAGYFLINDGDDYVSTEGLGLPGQWWSAYDTDLGDATSGRYLWNGVWRRDFTRGIVLLNEPGGTTKTLGLGGTFTTTSGQPVSSVTLGASRGAVLKAA